VRWSRGVCASGEELWGHREEKPVNKKDKLLGPGFGARASAVTPVTSCLRDVSVRLSASLS
jgi:hypothetical protein